VFYLAKEAHTTNNKAVTKEEVLNALREVYDPEIPLNVVDLGMIYDASIKDKKISVLMTLTSPMCPMGSYIQMLVEQALEKSFKGYELEVTLTFDPPWTPERINVEKRKDLGI
jgi:metal-sulfur cluster biosynthetic enzyme